MLALQALTFFERNNLNQQAHLELCHRNPDILEKVLDQILLSNSTVGKCAPMQVIKQSEGEGRGKEGDKSRQSFAK